MKKLYNQLNKIIEYMLVGIFGLLVIDVLWQVLSRYLIGRPSSFTEELARFALIWLSVLGAAYLNAKRAHLSIDYLVQKLSPEKQVGRRKVIEIFMALFAFVVMVIGGGNLVYITLVLGQTSSALHIPLGFIYAIVPISGMLIVFFSLHNILHPEQVAST